MWHRFSLIDNLSLHEIRNRWRTITSFAWWRISLSLSRFVPRDDFRFLNRRGCKHLQREQWFFFSRDWVTGLHNGADYAAFLTREKVRSQKAWSTVQLIRIREIGGFTKATLKIGTGFNHFINSLDKSKFYFRIRSSKKI